MAKIQRSLTTYPHTVARSGHILKDTVTIPVYIISTQNKKNIKGFQWHVKNCSVAVHGVWLSSTAGDGVFQPKRSLGLFRKKRGVGTIHKIVYSSKKEKKRLPS